MDRGRKGVFNWTIAATDRNERYMSGASVGRLSKISLRHSMFHLSSIGGGVSHATGISGKVDDRSEQRSSAFCFLVDAARAAVPGKRMEEPEAFPLPPARIRTASLDDPAPVPGIRLRTPFSVAAPVRKVEDRDVAR